VENKGPALTEREFLRGGCCQWLLSAPEAAKNRIPAAPFFYCEFSEKKGHRMVMKM